MRSRDSRRRTRSNWYSRMDQLAIGRFAWSKADVLANPNALMLANRRPAASYTFDDLSPSGSMDATCRPAESKTVVDVNPRAFV